MHIREHVPQYWGVITVELVDGVFDFYILRQPQQNPKVTWNKKLEILWRPELALLQELYQMPKYKEKSKSFVVNKMVERLEFGKIEEFSFKEQVSNILLERDYNTIEENLARYREGEITKKLEQEKDPKKQMELLAQSQVKKNLKKIFILFVMCSYINNVYNDYVDETRMAASTTETKKYLDGNQSSENVNKDDATEKVYPDNMQKYTTTEYELRGEYANIDEVLDSKVIDNRSFREVIMDDDTELVGQD